MKVRYWWSEDGTGELCDYQKTVAKQSCRCYHCDQDIPVNATVVQLRTSDGETFLLHEACGKKGIQSS